MKLLATRVFQAPPEKVFAALVDPAVLQKCVEGCEEMQKTGEDQYQAKLKIGVAGIKGNYKGTVIIEDKNPPHSFTLRVQGNGTPGWVKGTAKIQISPKAEGSELQCDAEGQVGGLIASVGSRLVEAAGKKMLDQFLNKLAGELARSDWPEARPQ
jgi:uncharacterized protein